MICKGCKLSKLKLEWSATIIDDVLGEVFATLSRHSVYHSPRCNPALTHWLHYVSYYLVVKSDTAVKLRVWYSAKIGLCNIKLITFQYLTYKESHKSFSYIIIYFDLSNVKYILTLHHIGPLIKTLVYDCVTCHHFV